MTCSVKKLSASTPNMTMAHSQNLLSATNANNQFMYQGQATVRNMLVDMWAMEQNGISIELYFLPRIGPHTFQPLIGMFIKNSSVVEKPDFPRLFQELFKAEGKPWVEPQAKDSESNQSSKPGPMFPRPPLTGDQLAWGLQMERIFDMYTSYKEINIFHYSPLHLDTDNFQVSHCFQKEEISHVMIIIMAHFYKDVLTNYVSFTNNLRSALAEKTGFSLLHISNLEATPHMMDDNKTQEATKVTFDLLGDSPIPGNKKKSLSQAKEDLVKAINNGISFHVQYPTISKDFIVHKSLYILDYDHKQQDHSNTNIINGAQSVYTEMSDSSNMRYEASTVAGIAIGTLLLGAALGCGAIFIMYRCKHHDEPLVSYNKQSNC